MTVFFSLYFLILIIDYRNLIKRKNKGEIIVYSILTVITVVCSFLYYKNTLGPSLVEMLTGLFNVKV